MKQELLRNFEVELNEAMALKICFVVQYTIAFIKCVKSKIE